MNNKPVAYGMLTFCKNCGEQNPYAVKELTDEEIIEIWEKHYGEENVMTLDKFFVKAILKKASEK